MKFALAVLATVLVFAPAYAAELFSARCVPALSKGEISWRVEVTTSGLAVRYSDPKKKFAAEIAGAGADALRAKIAKLQLSQRDIEFLRSREDRVPGAKKEEEQIVLRPFDGVTYHFSFPASAGVRVVTVDNPSFDLEHHGSFEETKLLQEVLALLDDIARIAKKEKEANQTPEPTAPSGRGSS